MRSKKALLNTITSLTYQMVSIVCGLITPRIILSTFGSAYNGVMSSITQFLSIISFLTIGIAGATRVELYKTLAEGDILGTSRIIRANEKYMKKVAIALILYTFILMLVYPHISHSDIGKIEISMLIGIISIQAFCEYFFGITYKTLLMADQKEYIYSILQIISTIINTIIVVVLVLTGCGILCVKFVSISVFAVVPLILNSYVKKKYSLVKECEANESALYKRKAVAFHSVANIIHDNTDLLLLTLFCDVKVISVYTVYNFVVGKIKMLMRTFTSGLEAAFGNMWIKKEYDNIQHKFKLYEFIIYSFVAVIFSCVSILIIPFISLYTRGVNDIEYISYSVAALFLLAEAIFCIRQPYLTLVQAVGAYEETKRAAGMEAIINIAVSLFLVKFMGLEGVIIGTIVANLFRTVQYIIYVSRIILNRGFVVVFKRLLVLILNITIIFWIGEYIRKIFSIDSWLNWILLGCAVFLVSLIVTIVFNCLLYKDELCDLWSILIKTFKKSRKGKKYVDEKH